MHVAPRRVCEELAKCRLPQPVGDAHIRRRGLALELLRKAAEVASPDAAARMLTVRDAYFLRRVVGDLPDGANILAQAGALPRGLDKRDRIFVVSQPSLSRRYLRRELQLQAELRPEWSSSLTAIPSIEAIERSEAELSIADGILALSSFAAKTFTDEGIEESKLSICPLGVDLSLFRPDVSRSAQFKVLFVGRITDHKGVADLIDAFKLARLPRGATLRFVGKIVGGIEEQLSRYSFLLRSFRPSGSKTWHWSTRPPARLCSRRLETGLPRPSSRPWPVAQRRLSAIAQLHRTSLSPATAASSRRPGT